MSPTQIVFAGLLCLASLSLAGCAGDEAGSKGPSPIDAAPALPSASPRVVETDDNGFPKLPAGAGEIDADAPTEFETAKSGLRYRILRKSDGRKPKPAHHIVANYRGWLDNGQEFDSSYRRGEPLDIALRSVVPGWQEGLQFVGEGGMIELEIPSELGYGASRQGDIPPNSTLHFIVELKKVR